jgi:NADH-quinone oxidoreductase subunit N
MLATLLQTTPPGADVIPAPSIAWSGLLPMLILFGGAIVLMVASALSGRRELRGVHALYTVIVAGGAIVAAIPLWNRVHDAGRGPFSTVDHALTIDGFSVFFMVVIPIAVILAALIADGYLRRENLEGAEFYVLVLLSATGGVVMAMANDLIVIFLGLEILSIAAYVLTAMHLRRISSQEAALKYFVLGAFSSAFFLYGIALVYGATGTTNLSRIFAYSQGIAVPGEIAVQQVVNGPPALLLAGFALLLVGFGFKIAAVPFHSWAPDVYQGAPSASVVYMAAAVKAAAFAGLLRVFVVAFQTYADDWRPYVFALAVATLLVGSILAIVQTNVKRMLAYSSIAHAGYVLVGVDAASQAGVAGALFYLIAYTFMVAGSFGVVTVVARRGDARHDLSDYAGLGRRQPVLAFVFTVFLLAQAGVPLTSGFFAKFYVLDAAVAAHSYALAVIAMMAAVIGAFVYLRIIVTMYAGAGDEEEVAAAPARRIHVPLAAKLALAVAFAFTVVVGFLPSPVAEFTQDATPVVAAPE